MNYVKATAAIAVLLCACSFPALAEGQACTSPPPSSYNITFDSNQTGNFEIYTMHTDGTGRTQLTNNTAYDSWWSRVSPDWTTILFYRTPAGVHDSDYSKTSLWEMNADGTNVHQVITNGQYWPVMGHGEWSPDGTKLVMLGGSNIDPTWQIYITPVDVSWTYAITSANVIHLDPSFSPDQQKVLYISCSTYNCPSTAYQVYSTSSLGGGAETALTSFSNRYSQNDPYYSPDLSTIAWLNEWSNTGNSGSGSWGIDSIPAAGGTDTPLVKDGSITSLPRWSAKGDWIYTHRWVASTLRYEIYRVCKDGTQLTPVTTNNADRSDEYVGPEYLTGVNGNVTPPSAKLTPRALYTLTGSSLSTGTASTAAPYPTTLNGTTVTMRDALGNQLSAGISDVSPTAVTFQLPSNAAPGYATIWVTNSSMNMYSTVVDINPASPGTATTTTSVAASPTEIALNGPLSLTATVKSSTAGTMTGTVTFTIGGTLVGTASVIAGTSSAGTAALAVGSASSTLGFTVGNDLVTAAYSGDSNYASSTGSTPVTVTAPVTTTPTVTATPSPKSITTAQSLTVTVRVNPTSGNPTPTGSVTVASGTYTSSSSALNSGTTTIVVPAGTLPTGSDTLTVSYTPDSASSSIYNSASTTVHVTVTTAVNPGFTIAGTTVNVAPGATTSNTSTVTVGPRAGFTGNVVLTAAITSSPGGSQDLPVLSFGSTSPVSITGNTAGTATLTVSTTAPGGVASIRHTERGLPWYAAGGLTLAGMFLFCVPSRRNWLKRTGAIALLVAVAMGVSACGSGGGGSVSTAPGTPAGAYTITVTGTSGAITAAGTVTLNVN